MPLFRRGQAAGRMAASTSVAAPAQPPGPSVTDAPAVGPALARELAAMTSPATYARDLPVRLLLEGDGAFEPADEFVLPAALWERIGDLARAYWLSLATLAAERPPGPMPCSPAWDLVIFSRGDQCAADMAVEGRFLAEMVADPLLRRYLRALAALLDRWSTGPADRLVVATVGADTTEPMIQAYRSRYLG